MTRTIPRRVAAVIAAVALVCASALMLSSPSHAAPLIDPTETGTLHITKYEMPEGGAGSAANGLPQPGLPHTPMEGVGFTVSRVNVVDLTTNEGWLAAQELAGLQIAADPVGTLVDAGFTVAAGTEHFTDSAGKITVSGLPLGVYLVQETSPGNGATPAAPFLVTLPMTDPVGLAEWLYEVHVYPKNALTTASKTVSDAGAAALGDTISFTITSGIPEVAVLEAYQVHDDFDSRLKPEGVTVALSNAAELIAETDWTYTIVDNKVEVVFTPAGLKKLVENSTADVVVTISAKVLEVGEIENQAYVYQNKASLELEPGDPGGPTPTDTVETKWGGITLEKVGDDLDGDGLAGAVFEVYLTRDAAIAGAAPIEFDGQTAFEVDDQGMLTISGLRYSDWADGEAVGPADPGYRTYWLRETVAPTGYELLAQPIEFVVNAETTAIGVDMQIVNIAKNIGFDLPLTGGTGTTVFLAGGVLLVAGAALLTIHVRRRSARA